MADSPSDVRYEKQALVKIKPLYRRIRAAIEGSTAVKALRLDALPHPNPAMIGTTEGSERYSEYLMRAVWYGYVGGTVKGHSGQIFAREPVIKLPTSMEPMVNDVNGGGLSLVQQAMQVVEDQIAVGRHGLLADYPKVEGPVTQADVDAGNIRPRILNYRPEDVINWRTSVVNNRKMLTLVVVRDVNDHDNGETYGEDLQESYRELRLVDGVYRTRFWIENASGSLEVSDWVEPEKAGGGKFSEILFTFVGADNNDSDIDDPPMRDIAEINYAHFRNSADYEDSVFIVGQPTPVVAGLDRQWVTDVLKDKPIVYGSRVAVKLPKGATMDLLQPEPNTLVGTAMDKKEKLMVALGARIVQEKTAQTATEFVGNRTTQTSILHTISANATAAYLKVFEWCCEFTGADFGSVEFELNTDFDLAKMSPEQQQAIIASWVGGAISFTEMRFNLKKGGVAFQDDEDAKEEIDSSKQEIKLDDDDEEDLNNPPRNQPPEEE